MSVGFTWHFTLRIVAPLEEQEHDELAEHVDLVMRELLALEACDSVIRDTGIGLNTATGRVEIDLTATGDSYADAFARAETSLRTAIHAAGGYTPDWDDPDTGSVAYDDQRIELERVPA